MNKQEDIILGYCKIIKPQKIDKLSDMPSKIGGEPVIYIKLQTFLIPLKQQIQCQNCKQQMYFLLQIFSPLEMDNAYNRMIYVFYCQNQKCQIYQNSIQIIRQQLYENDEIVKEENLQFQSIQQQFKIKTEIQESKEFRKQYKQCYDLANEDELWDECENEEIEINDPQQAEQLIQQYLNQNKVAVFQEEVDVNEFDEIFKDNNKKIDLSFQIYQQMIQKDRGAIIRFCRNEQTTPLYYTDKLQLNKIKKCQNCNGDLIFEFQINNTILNHIQELLEFDWGIIAIYTCKLNCDIKIYNQEFSFIQLNSEENQFYENINNDSSFNSNLQENNLQIIEEEKPKKKKNKKKKKKQEKILSDDDWA